jgi:chaperonin GroES
MKFKYKPLKDRVIITQDKAEEKTASGIFIPESAQEKPQKGTVIAVSDNSELKTGDRVIYQKYGGEKLEIDNTEYVLLKENDILLVEDE